MRRLFFRLWGMLPTAVQTLLIYLGSPKSTTGVAAIIPDEQGRVLMVRHTYRRPAWNFPGGLIGRREQPDVALARELREELGVEPTVGPLLHADHYFERHHYTLYYRVAIAGTPRHDIETDAHRYVELSEIPDLLGVPLPWLSAALSGTAAAKNR